MIDAPWWFVERDGKKKRPYIGITGFTNEMEIDHAMDYYYKYQRETGHQLMIGVLLSKSVVDLGIHPKPERRARYPPLDAIPGLLEHATGDVNVMRTVHYNTRGAVLDEIGTIMNKMGWKGLVDAFQLNVPFPPFVPEEARSLKKAYPGLKIIIQLKGSDISRFSLSHVCKAIALIEADHVLIDSSGGKGKNVDMKQSSSVFNKVTRSTKAIAGFAGGFGDHNVQARVEEYKRILGTRIFSVDAETHVRDAKDRMDDDRVHGYIKGFFTGMGG